MANKHIIKGDFSYSNHGNVSRHFTLKSKELLVYGNRKSNGEKLIHIGLINGDGWPEQNNLSFFPAVINESISYLLQRLLEFASPFKKIEILEVLDKVGETYMATISFKSRFERSNSILDLVYCFSNRSCVNKVILTTRAVRSGGEFLIEASAETLINICLASYKVYEELEELEETHPTLILNT